VTAVGGEGVALEKRGVVEIAGTASEKPMGKKSAELGYALGACEKPIGKADGKQGIGKTVGGHLLLHGRGAVVIPHFRRRDHDIGFVTGDDFQQMLKSSSDDRILNRRDVAPGSRGGCDAGIPALIEARRIVQKLGSKRGEDFLCQFQSAIATATINDDDFLDGGGPDDNAAQVALQTLPAIIDRKQG
jgi:hypothetical protein